VATAASAGAEDCALGYHASEAASTACLACADFEDGENHPFYFADATASTACAACACNNEAGTDTCDATTGECVCSGLFKDSATGLQQGVDVDCVEEQDMSLAIASSYAFFFVFLVVLLPLIFASGLLAAVAGVVRRDVSIIVHRMRRRTEKAVRLHRRKETTEARQLQDLHLRSAFKLIDEDASGNVDVDEVAAFFEDVEIKVAKEDLALALAAADVEGNGELGLEAFREFVSIVGQKDHRIRKESSYRQAFENVEEGGGGGGGGGSIDAERARDAASMLGISVTDNDMALETGRLFRFEGKIDFAGFDQLLERYVRERAQRLSKTSTNERKHLQKRLLEPLIRYKSLSKIL
jgi:Ca2+-binding EF-hand superfamily protein